jgi:hypothetical protein
MAEETQDLLLTKMPVYVLDALEREGARFHRNRLAHIRYVLEQHARRYIAREATANPPEQE